MSQGSLLNRDSVIGKRELYRERFDVPEWGGAVMIRGLKGKDKAAYEIYLDKAGKEPAKYTDFRERLLSMMLVDEADNYLFPGDAGVLELTEMNAHAISRLYERCLAIAFPSAEILEEITKNLLAPPSDSISGSAES